jgi:hypothetical protein
MTAPTSASIDLAKAPEAFWGDGLRLLDTFVIAAILMLPTLIPSGGLPKSRPSMERLLRSSNELLTLAYAGRG